MAARTTLQITMVASCLGLALAGCSFAEPGPNPVVFGDSFVDNEYQRFLQALGPIAVDPNEKIEGFASLKITVPDNGCAGSDLTHYCYAGGALVGRSPRDLSGYNALTFWAKASSPNAMFSEVGFGNDNSGGSKYVVTKSNLKLTTDWVKYFIPVPLGSKLTREKGLFFFSAGNVGGVGFNIWVDAVQFEHLDASVLGPVRPARPDAVGTKKAGSQFSVTGATVTAKANGADVTVSLMPAYFTWSSSDPTVATVNAGGVVTTKAPGVTTIGAKLGDTDAAGTFKVIVPGGTTAAGPLQVFTDSFVGAGYQAFGNALGTISFSTAEQHTGTTSLEVNVPGDGCPGADGTHFCYAGGAVVASDPQDLSLSNALTFWAKATNPAASFDVAGFGNDNTGTSLYTSSTKGLKLTQAWAKYYLPIPLPRKLGNERGLFFFAASNASGVGYNIYLDDVQFEQVDASVLGPPRPAIPGANVLAAPGASFKAGDATVTFAVNGADVVMSATPLYFDWASSDTKVGTVGADGAGVTVGPGRAVVTATLKGTAGGDVTAAGEIDLQVLGGVGSAGPLVFVDDLVDASFQPFGNALGGVHTDTAEKHAGFSSLRIDVPSAGCPGSDGNHFCYAGGAVVANSPRDLSAFSALTFWAKASVPAQFDQAGLGNDNTGTSKYIASEGALAISTTWTKYYLPIPLPAKLVAERGLFFFAASNQAGNGYSIWLDDVQFEQVDPSILGPARPKVASRSVNVKPGAALPLNGTVTFAVNGADQTLAATSAWFTWTSSNPAVAAVDASGIGTALAFGSANLTATLGDAAAVGALAVVVPGGGTLPGPLQIFTDDFIGTGFQAFSNALGTLKVTTAEHHAGTSSIQVHVPSNGCAGASLTTFCYAGGALVAATPQDLSLFNVLTFWAKASSAGGRLDQAGLGNDNSGGSKYTVTASGLALGTTWQKYFIAIPLPAKLTAEKGMFWFAASNVAGVGYDLFIDDLQFEAVATPSVLGPARPTITGGTLNKVPGDTFGAPGVGVTFAINGVDQVLGLMPSYFTWTSSDPTVAALGSDGSGTALKLGAATVTAKLGSVPAVGAVAVNVVATAGPAGPLVFNDDLVDASFQPFGNTLGTARVDTAEKHSGTASLRIDVPSNGCAGADTTHFCYAGGALVANSPRDLSPFNALTFWAKASVAGQFDTIGLGNDNSGTSKYISSRSASGFTTAWTKYYLPIPLSAKLTAEKGLFYFAASNQAGTGYTVWLDDVQYEQLDSSILGPPRPALPSTSTNVALGAPLVLSATVTFAVNGVDQVLNPSPGYFTWTSSDQTVAQVAPDGTGTALSYGTANLSASLGAVPATGTLAIIVPGGAGCATQTLPCTQPGPLQIFTDDFNATTFQSFGTALGPLRLNTTEFHSGTASLEIHVPSDGCARSDTTHFCYAGGAFVAAAPQDLSLFNVLTFWAKASNASAKFNDLGLANDNSGTSKYQTDSNAAVPLTTTWKKYYVPIPAPAKLTSEKGMFWFTGAPIGASVGTRVGYSIFIDDMQFELITDPAVLGPARPVMSPGTLNKVMGDSFSPPAAAATWKINSVDQTFNLFSSNFSWTSSAPAVATVGVDGSGLAVSPGTALITATLGNVPAAVSSAPGAASSTLTVIVK